MGEAILWEKPSEGVAVLRINRPGARNALTWEAMEAFAQAVEHAHTDPHLRALVLTGSDGTFCAGGDLYELHNYPTYADGERLATIMGEALDRLEDLPAITVAAIEGHALGGGAEIALACDLRVMAEGTQFGLMHVRLGICPAWGGGQRLLRMVGYSTALEWLALGRVLTAEEAAAHGLASRVVPRGQALQAALDLAGQIAAQDPGAVRGVKRLLRAGLTLPPEEAAAVERSVFPQLWAAPAHLQASERFVNRRRAVPG